MELELWVFLSLHPSPLSPSILGFRVFTSTKLLMGAFPSQVDAFGPTCTGRLSVLSEPLTVPTETRRGRWVL